MDKVRIGVIGVGGIGTHHIKVMSAIEGLQLAAVCDIVPEKIQRYECARFTDSRDLIRSGLVDAVTIGTPHYFHTPIAIDALQNGVHCLTEKPIAVHKNDAQKMIAAHTDPKVLSAAMFNQRTDPRFRKIRELIRQGHVGEIRRVTWIITNWFRTQAYYDSGGWRATWVGEGGGVLTNQCPHNLDMLWWLCGSPRRVTAVIGLGKYHNIEVEDEVTAILEYPNGAIGTFMTSTAEAPGTNRLEIAGENGRLVFDGGKIHFTRNEVPMTEFSRTSKEGFALPPVWEIDVPVSGSGEQHAGILKNFRDAILRGTELLSPAEEGIHSVEMANAMLLSGLHGRPVDLPLDGDAFEAELKGLIARSTQRKSATDSGKAQDLSGTFNVQGQAAR
jgi:predicted dehydrogenase